MEQVIEFDRKNITITICTDYAARRKYPVDVLNMLYQDGHAFVNSNIEIFFEGCNTPHIDFKQDM